MDPSIGVAKFRALDAWRGICALLVVLFHLSVAGSYYDLPFVRDGGRGVDFFFVLSGFVIDHAYGHKLKDWSGGLRFIVRRFGRLYPLHLFTLMLLVALELVKLVLVRSGIGAGQAPFSGANSLASLAGNLVLINGLGVFNDFTWNGPSWSISTEFFAYLFFLAVTLSFPKRSRLAAAAVTIIAGVAVVLNEMSASPLSTIRGAGLMSCLFLFFLGTFVHQAYVWLSPKLSVASWWEWVVFGAAIAVFAVKLPFEGVIEPLIFAAVVFVFAFERGPISTALLTPIPQHLGLISYSIYLMHWPGIELMNSCARALQSKLHLTLFVPRGGAMLLKFGPPIAMDVFALAFVLAIVASSTLTYRWIEDPARGFFNRLSNRVSRPRAQDRAPPVTQP